LMRDAGERLQPHRIADLTHARRIAVLRDRGLDDLEDRHLLRAEVLATTSARRLGVGGGDVAHGAPSCAIPGLLFECRWPVVGCGYRNRIRETSRFGRSVRACA